MNERSGDKQKRAFRKKPVVIEASQWWMVGDHPAVKRWTIRAGDPMDCGRCKKPYNEHGGISTLEDTDLAMHFVCPGDWIITGVQGEHYACKPDIFAATYEPKGSRPSHVGTPEQEIDDKTYRPFQLVERLCKACGSIELARQGVTCGKCGERFKWSVPVAPSSVGTPERVVPFYACEHGTPGGCAFCNATNADAQQESLSREAGQNRDLRTAPSGASAPDAAAWDGNADGLTALLEENKRLKELAKRQMNDAEAARLEIAEAKALLARSSTATSDPMQELRAEEIAEFNAGYEAFQNGIPYADIEVGPHDNNCVGWAWAFFNKHYRFNKEALSSSATSTSDLAEIEEALWRLHNYESNRDDAGQVYSEADITKMVAALRAVRTTDGEAKNG